MMAVPRTQTVANPQKHGYHAVIDDLLVRLAVSPDRPLTTRTSELQPQRVQTEANPEDFTPVFGDVFSQTEWTGGEGLLNRYRPGGEESDETRFWASEHVDVSATDDAVPEEMRLLNTTTNVDSITGNVRIAASGTTLWATSGQTLRKTSDITASNPSFSNDDPHAGDGAVDVEDVTVRGDIPYAALGSSGIHRDDGGWSHWSDVTAVRVWVVFDRIVTSSGAAGGDVLSEAASGTDSVTLYTLPSGETWVDVIETPGAVLAAASNGFVYSFTLNDSDELEVTGQSPFPGETPVGLAARSNLVYVTAAQGDELRLWQTEYSSGLLGNYQLLKEWNACSCGEMTATRDRVFIGILEAGEAWAWQLELATTGLFKANQLGDGTVDGITAVDGLLVAGCEDDGVFVETDTLQSEGWLISSRADFFRADEKSWVTGWADVDIDGGMVELYYSTVRAALFDDQHSSWTLVHTYTDDSASVERPLVDVTARALAWQVRLTPSAGGSPKVRTVAFRAYPSEGDVLLELPVSVSDQVERHGRRRLTVPKYGQEILEALRAYEGQAALCRVYRTGEAVRGLVESVVYPVPSMPRRGSVSHVAMVTVRGRRVDAGEAGQIGTTGSGAWGAFRWGGRLWGGSVGEVEVSGGGGSS